MRDRPKRSALTLSVPLATGLHRAALACLDDALAEIRRDRRDPERTVHRVRRELKRFRACLRLVRVPQSDWGNALLADATALARQLSPLRDRWVARRTFEHLRMRHPNDCWQVVAKSFPQPPRSGRPAHIPNPSARWERRLVAMRATVLAHAFPPCTVAGLAESLRRSYRTARKTRAAAMARPTPLNIHARRKAVVRLYHQSAYVRPLL